MAERTIPQLLQQIRETDNSIIHRLAERVRLSQEFYALEAENNDYHPEQERLVKEHISKLAKEAQLDEELVKKLYKRILKHAHKHRRRVHKVTVKKIKQLDKVRGELKKQL